MCNCGRGNRAPREPGTASVGVVNTFQQRTQAVVHKGPVIHDPVLWGPHLWAALHTLSIFVSFQAAKNEWVALLTNMVVSLPCPDCTGHYRKWLKTHPFTLMRHRRSVGINTSLNITTWILDLHNDAVRAAIDATRAMVGQKAIQGLEQLLTRM
jgi:hypothetical protein